MKVGVVVSCARPVIGLQRTRLSCSVRSDVDARDGTRLVGFFFFLHFENKMKRFTER